MNFLRIIFFAALLNFGMSSSTQLFACESCTIPRLGRDSQGLQTSSKDQKWVFKYLYEEQNWKEIPAGEAHALHHDGHHVHDKTEDSLYHFSLGRRLTEKFTLSAEIPYAIKRSIEIDSHARLGRLERSEGWGDLHVFGDYEFLRDDNRTAGVLGGVKFPTGMTGERNSGGGNSSRSCSPARGRSIMSSAGFTNSGSADWNTWPISRMCSRPRAGRIMNTVICCQHPCSFMWISILQAGPSRPARVWQQIFNMNRNTPTRGAKSATAGAQPS